MDESDLYDEPILARARTVPRLGRLTAPDISVERVSRVCGSRVTVDLKVDGGRVVDFAQAVDACALGKASAAILGSAIIGCSAGDIRDAVQRLRAMLKHRAPAPGGRWADLGILAPVADIPTRHASVLLPFEAAEEALARLDAQATGTTGQTATG